MKIAVTLFIVFTLFLPNTFAQDYTLWDAATGIHIRTLTGHTRDVTSVSFSPDGGTIASGSRDDTIRLWDVATGAHIRTITTGHMFGVNSVSFSPDGRTIASGSPDDTIRLWDAATGAHIRTLTGTGHTPGVYSISVSPDGRTIASGSWDATIRLWDAATGAHIRTLTGHTREVWSVSFSPDGRTIASAGGFGDATIRLWDAATGTHLRTLTGHTGEVLSVSFSPDGRTIASGSPDETLRTIRLWDAATGAHLRTLTGHTDQVNSVSFSPDGGTIASVGSQGARLFDAATGAHIRTLTGHTNWVYSVSFSPDGRTIASGSRDNTIRLWELIPVTIPLLVEDVNEDGVVNILDLVLVAGQLGQTGQNDADVNGDGIVNILDLVLIAGALGQAAAAPALPPGIFAPLTATDVERWLTEAQNLDLTDAQSKRGILFLERLLIALTPKETVLLPNYPNPFNPETWIPYHLASAADVQVTIYDTKGTIVRQLDLGHQPAGYYTDRAKAAYWNGRNASGESVASGVYFYQLRAADYSALRRMVIVK